jgi:hypothetical protein
MQSGGGQGRDIFFPKTQSGEPKLMEIPRATTLLENGGGKPDDREFLVGRSEAPKACSC